MPQHRQVWIALGFVTLLAVGAWLLWPGIHGPFLFDDEPNLKNLAELDGHFNRQSIGVYLALFNGTPGRPLAALSFLLNDYAWPSTPLGFKLTNLWIHLLNGVLVFGLARTLAGAYGDHAEGRRANGDLAALACAAIWLLSPIQVSAVFLTVQRMAEMAATFMFGGLWAYAAIGLKTRTALQAFLALIMLGTATVLALLCKENGILTPILALVLHVTVLRKSISAMPARPAHVLRLGITTTVVLLITTFAWKWSSLTSFASRDYTMWERVMTQGRALADYISLITIPRLSGSGLYNDDFIVSRNLLSPATTLPALLLILAALVGALWMQRRKPLFSFAVLWFLAAHLLESSVFPLEMYFEHRNYVPLFGPAFAIAMAIMRVHGDLRRPVLIGLGLWLALAGGILHLQAKVWGDESILATVWHNEHPNSLRAQQQYASYLLDSGRGREAHAVMAAAAAQGISPVDSQLQALTVECSAHRLISPATVAESMERLRSAALAPGTAMILARLRLSVQQDDCPGAISPRIWLAMTQAVLDNPRGNGIWRMLLVERAELFLAMKQLDSAIHELDVAYGNHTDPRIAFYGAALLATAGRYDEARIWARRPLGQPWSWKRWLAQTDAQAKTLINAIDDSQARTKHPRVAAPSPIQAQH